MDYTSNFSINKPRVLCYAVGTLFAVQSVQSAYLGFKKIVHTIHGSTPYAERITGVAESQIAVLKQSRDVCIGCDTAKERLMHLKEAFKSLTFAAIEGLIATILFVKDAYSPAENIKTPSPETEAKLQKFDGEFMETFFNSSEVSQHMKKISCFSLFYNMGGSDYYRCEKEALFEQLNKPHEIKKFDSSEKKELLTCSKTLAIYKMMSSDYMGLSHEVSKLQGAEITRINALSKILKGEVGVGRNTISRRFNTSTADNALRALESYTKYLMNNAKLYVKIHKERLENYTITNMTQHWGPITAHLNKMCDSEFFKELYLQSDKFCTNYFDLKNKYLEAEKKMDAIFEDFSTSIIEQNCKQSVFDPALKEPILEKLLTPSQYQSLQSLLAWKAERKNRNKLSL